MTSSTGHSSWAAAAVFLGFFALIGVGVVSCNNSPCAGHTPQTITAYGDGRTETVCR